MRDVGGRRGGGRWALGLLLAMAGCTRPRTQLVVGVDTDLAWGPGEVLRSIQVTVRSNDPEGQLRDRRVVELGPANPLPASFGVVPLDDDASRRVWIEVRGCGARGCDDPLVTQRAYVGFVEGQTLLLRMTLAGACQGVACTDPTEVCLPTTGVCGSARVEASALPAWTGVVPRVTGDVPGVLEAGSDAAEPDAADGAADDAATMDTSDADASDAGADVEVVRDVAIDQGADVGCAATCGGACVDLQRDALNCGTCGRECSTARANSVAGCAAGACEVRCAEGFGDCDGNVANGCEARLAASAAHCGRCGGACPARANASAVCVEGGCGFTCNAGFADCDGDGSNGCEVATATSVMHCGACGSACRVANATAACTAGACRVGACATGWGNCDGSDANGCERGLLTDAANCGGCGVACRPANATGACVASVCGVGACATGYGDCDGSAANGCETDVRVSVAHCGRCGAACAAGDYCENSACRLPNVRHVLSRTVATTCSAVRGTGADALGNAYVLVDEYTCSGPFRRRALRSYDASGAMRWERLVPGSEAAMAMDSTGTVTIRVTGTSALDFGGGPVLGTGVFLASYDGSGSLRWARYIGGTGSGYGLLLATDDAGNIYVAGMQGGFDLGSGPVGDGIWVGSLTSDGVPRWVRSVAPMPTRPSVGSLVFAIQPLSGEVCLALRILDHGLVNFGGGPLGGSTLAEAAVAVGCFDALGTHLWSQLFPRVSAGTIFIAMNRASELALAGLADMYLSPDFGCGPIVVPSEPAMYWALLDRARRCVASTGWPGVEVDRAGIALDDDGNAYALARMAGAGTVGSGALPSGAFLASWTRASRGRWSFTLSGARVTLDGAALALVRPRSLQIASGGMSGMYDYGGGTIGVTGTSAFFVRYAQ